MVYSATPLIKGSVVPISLSPSIIFQKSKNSRGPAVVAELVRACVKLKQKLMRSLFESCLGHINWLR